jgi:acylphosphatase
MTCVLVHYEGSVQGVGFRWTVKNLAREFEVTGTVKNLPDGRVELLVQGEDAEAFLEAIRQSVLAGHIVNERMQTQARVPGLRGFSILP